MVMIGPCTRYIVQGSIAQDSIGKSDTGLNGWNNLWKSNKYNKLEKKLADRSDSVNFWKVLEEDSSILKKVLKIFYIWLNVC